MELTQKHYELFKAECEQWINRLGITSWNVFYAFEDMRQDSTFARCYSDKTQRSATLALTKDSARVNDETDYNELVKSFAKHEVLELLLTRLSDMATENDVDRDTADEATHEVINLLMRALK